MRRKAVEFWFSGKFFFAFFASLRETIPGSISREGARQAVRSEVRFAAERNSTLRRIMKTIPVMTHVDEEGRMRMVDVGDKPSTRRTAVATGFVRMSRATASAVKSHRTPKGNPLEAARLAGILAAKRTAELIPLCHSLPLDHVDIQFVTQADGVAISATASTDSKTGVEMEALVAVSVAALTIYDMCKAIDRGMLIEGIALESKTGGRSGDYIRPKSTGASIRRRHDARKRRSG